VPGRDRLAILLVSLLLLAILVLFNFDHTVDDAFIGFRYAENLARGEGLVYNPGERVEGYTNFLWVVLLSPFAAFALDLETVSKCLGLLASAGTLAAVTRLSPGGDRWRGIPWVAPLLLASSPPFVIWTTGGMETPLFLCLLAWAAVLCAEGMERGGIALLAGALLGAAALTRPEGAGVAVVLAGLAFVLGPRTPAFRRSLFRVGAVFLTVFLPYFAWRVRYYGHLLPNTFYAKVGFGPAQIARGLQYTHAFFAYSGYGLLLPLVGLRWCGARRRLARLLGGLTLALAGAAIAVGGDALPMFRFLAPMLPSFVLLLALGTEGILARLGPARFARPAIAAALVVLGAWAARIGFTGAPYEDLARDSREVGAWKEIGAWLRRQAPPSSTVAVIPAGAIPYVSKLRAIDMLGLNDETIAHRELPGLGHGLPGHEKFDVDYVLGRRPDIVLLGVYGLDEEARPPEDLIHYVYEAEWRMLDAPRFRQEYRLRRGRTAGGYFPYFVRARDSG